MTLMYDTDNVSVLADARCAGALVATYADLVTPALATTYKGRLVVIDRGTGDPLNLATVADVETGALTIAQGVEKIKEWHAQNRPFPTVYVNRANWGAVDAALAGTPAFHWIATLDGTLRPNGRQPDVVQFAGAAAVGFHADVSLVFNTGWHPIRPYVDWARQAHLVTLAADIVTVGGQIEAIARSLA